jgi:hypothetical protein
MNSVNKSWKTLSTISPNPILIIKVIHNKIVLSFFFLSFRIFSNKILTLKLHSNFIIKMFVLFVVNQKNLKSLWFQNLSQFVRMITVNLKLVFYLSASRLPSFIVVAPLLINIWVSIISVGTVWILVFNLQFYTPETEDQDIMSVNADWLRIIKPLGSLMTPLFSVHQKLDSFNQKFKFSN